MSSRACLYAPGSWGDCFDLGCGSQGGRCELVEEEDHPWCRCKVAAPSPNVVRVSRGMNMHAQLEDYRMQICELPECEDGWFAEALAQYYAGDEEARRRILGSGLRVALQIAEARHDPASGDDVLDSVEEANRGLTQALRSFAGGNAQDFLRHVTETINARLDRRGHQP